MDNAADVFDFVIPEYMSHYGFLTTNTAFDMLPDKKAVETLNKAYIFCHKHDKPKHCCIQSIPKN